jgi:hypothetical protein
VFFDVGVSKYSTDHGGGRRAGVPEFAMEVDHMHKRFPPGGDLKEGTGSEQA